MSSKSAEFMKFTVGMLDASAVFLREKDGAAKITSPMQMQQLRDEENVDDEDDEQMMHDEDDNGEDVKTEHQQHIQPQRQSTYDYTATNNTTNYFSTEQPSPITSLANTTSPTTNDQPITNKSYSSYNDPSNSNTTTLDTTPQEDRTTWSNLAVEGNVDFGNAEIQDWNLDQLYNFENFPLAEEVLNHSRRFVREYDESGNAFSGF